MERNKIDESRIYTENGEVKVRHIINESTDIDMTPHPTENRVFVKNGEVVIVFSEEIENNDSTDLETARLILHESTKKFQLLNAIMFF